MEVSNDDLWTMLLATFRYSLGRMTYMPSVCVDLFDRYGRRLTLEQRQQIVKEVDDALLAEERKSRMLGMKCDHETWSKFVERYRNEVDLALLGYV